MPKTYRSKVCSLCGKSEGKNWSRHWKRLHPDSKIQELAKGSLPTDPFDENWIYLIEPLRLREQYQSAASKLFNEELNEVCLTEVIQNIDEATQIFDSKVGHLYKDSLTLEIDLEVDSSEISNEEDKDDGPIQFEDDEFSCLSTKILFKKAHLILDIIKERLNAKDASLRDQLKVKLYEAEKTHEFHVRPAYHTHGGNHLSLGRVREGHYVDSSKPKEIYGSFQFTTREKIVSKAQYTIDYLYGEINRVRQNITSIASIADKLQNISLPAQLTINECNVQIQVVDKSLSIRSRKLLKRPRKVMSQQIEILEQPIEYSSRPDPAKCCPNLYAKCDSDSDVSSEEEESWPREIRTNELGDSGDDLTNGILAVDGVRYLSNQVRNEVKNIIYLDLRDGLLAFIDARRAFLNRRLQYFINMVLLAHVGYRRQTVRVIFEDYWIEPRAFTVNVKPKEKRDYKKDSNYFLRSLQEVTQDITNILVEIMDFTKALKCLRVKDDEQNLLLPFFAQILESVENSLSNQQKLHQLQHILNESTKNLCDPDILKSLSEQQENKQFWMNVDLKSFVHWKMQKIY